MSSYIRVRYLRPDGSNAPTFDSCVINQPQDNFIDAVDVILKRGFFIPSTPSRYPDPQECSQDRERLITPGAIMSVTLCDERGWSKHDLKQYHKSTGHKKE